MAAITSKKTGGIKGQGYLFADRQPTVQEVFQLVAEELEAKQQAEQSSNDLAEIIREFFKELLKCESSGSMRPPRNRSRA